MEAEFPLQHYIQRTPLPEICFTNVNGAATYSITLNKVEHISGILLALLSKSESVKFSLIHQ